jgi:hypothetical protein
MSRFDIRHPAEGYWLFSNKGRVKAFDQARFAHTSMARWAAVI